MSNAIPDHLRTWWEHQYKAVQEFGQVLLREDSASPQLMSFFEMLARHCPKLRSVRMTNALHALWRQTPSALAFELAVRYCKSPTEIGDFAARVQRAMPQAADSERFEAELTLESTFADVLCWLEANEKVRPAG
ncbi:hypothetical protein [uncultured Propionivibrio sp.]|uniref:hypothetical protein n=1 Tax=uncultured Propionivibrio sp. TaxID=426737 RepID=UPI0029C0BD65|nr:hypothetical protein [uncultured Propionivibrio sp.]